MAWWNRIGWVTWFPPPRVSELVMPYLALGDETVLEEGMTFSMEPGLFYPEGGYGYNPSDTILVTKTTGVEMGSLPLSKEWCFLKL